MKNSIQQLIKTAAFAYIILFLLWLLLRLIVQDTLWWNAVLTSYPFLVTLPGWLLVGLLWFVAQERQWALGIGGLLVGLFLFQYGALFVPKFGAGGENGRSITALTYNVNFLNSDQDGMIEAIRAADADIVGLQEVTLQHTELIEAELSEQYPYRVFADPEFRSDVSLLSKYPVVELKQFVLLPRRMSLHAVVDVDGQLIDVIVVHLTPNEFRQRDGQSLPLRMRERYNLRRVEVTDILLELQQDTDNPALLLCDCNFTETSQVYRLLDREMTDVYKQAGWGLGRTQFLSGIPLPLVRVDYIWHTGEFGETAVSFPDRAASDHRPLLATLELPNQ